MKWFWSFVHLRLYKSKNQCNDRYRRKHCDRKCMARGE
jgi:hypothetical protein